MSIRVVVFAGADRVRGGGLPLGGRRRVKMANGRGVLIFFVFFLFI